MAIHRNTTYIYISTCCEFVSFTNMHLSAQILYFMNWYSWSKWSSTMNYWSDIYVKSSEDLKLWWWLKAKRFIINSLEMYLCLMHYSPVGVTGKPYMRSINAWKLMTKTWHEIGFMVIMSRLGLISAGNNDANLNFN